jgi:hypothetical protein
MRLEVATGNADMARDVRLEQREKSAIGGDAIGTEID